VQEALEKAKEQGDGGEVDARFMDLKNGETAVLA